MAETEPRLFLRRTYSDSESHWRVIDDEGEGIGVIVDQSDHISDQYPPWFWGISVFGLPQGDNDSGREATRKAAMAKVKAHWLTYKARYTLKEYEKWRRRFSHRRG